jgi:predicted HAD superfamily Cof-like phosphohydrolase
MNYYNLVKQFHEKMEIEGLSKPGLLPPDVMDFRLRAIHEEIQELTDAYIKGDLFETADGIVDAIYFLLGTAYLMALPLDDLFLEVHVANMNKQRCKEVSQSKRKFVGDCFKPEGWKQPSFDHILGGNTI